MSEKQAKKERTIREEIESQRVEVVISTYPNGNMEIKCSRNLPRKIQSNILHEAYTVMERQVILDEGKDRLFKSNNPKGFIDLGVS